MLATFMTSHTQNAGQKKAALTVVFSRLSTVDLIFFFFNTLDLDSTEDCCEVVFVFVFFIPTDSACQTSSFEVPFEQLLLPYFHYASLYV